MPGKTQYFKTVYTRFDQWKDNKYLWQLYLRDIEETYNDLKDYLEKENTDAEDDVI